MAKGNFSSTIDELLKSFSGKEEADKDKKKEVESEDNEAEDTLFDDDSEDDSDEEVDKGCMKKSFDEDELDGDYLDATDLMKSMAETIDTQKEEIATLKKSLEEVQENMIEVTKSFGEYIKTPNARNTIVQKSIDEGTRAVTGPSKRPTNEDFDILKSALVSAASKGEVSLEEVQYYNTEFQKSMAGQKIKPETWQKICSIVKSNR